VKENRLLRKFITDTNLRNYAEFEKRALSLFSLQAKENDVYKEYLERIHCNPMLVTSLAQIPFLPVRFFKSHKVISGQFSVESVFESSSTTGQGVSKHYVDSLSQYHAITELCFEKRFGKIQHYSHLALLPSYLERKGSSLIDMVRFFMEKSTQFPHGFYLNEFELLAHQINENQIKDIPTILWGVSFALLDFAVFLEETKISREWRNLIVIETGGMKGRRKELIRKELHDTIKRGFGRSIQIESEYGMTEMLSQCYTYKERFYPPPHVKIMGRDSNDPFSVYFEGKSKALNIIDLANVNSCCFIALSDIGTIYPDGSFEVLGRLDESDIRGCNLMVK
jgi:hypothetical protein